MNAPFSQGTFLGPRPSRLFSMPFKTACLASVASLSIFNTLHAEPFIDNNTVQEQADRVTYHPEYFKRFNPLTAFDMVNQLPGFTLIGESNDRGFSQGQGNLLINGKRPSTKSNSPKDILNRISSESILRVEILREGSSELSGQSGLIANIITRTDDSISGSYMVEGYFHEEGMFRPKTRLSVGGTKGNFSYNLEFFLDIWKHEEKGIENAFDASRSLVEIREEKRNVHNRTPKLNAYLGWNGDNGDVANLSFQAFYFKHSFDEISDRFGTESGQAHDLVRNINTKSGEDEYTYEIGGDYTTEFIGGNLKFIGLRRREDSRFFTNFDNSAVSGDIFRFNSKRRPIESETILRTLFTLQPAKNHTLEWAIEGAFNTLDTSATFEEDTGSGFENVGLNGSDTRVEERRAETSLFYSLPLSETIKLQASAAIEFSELSVSGSDNKKRSYVRPKGFIGLNYDITPETQFRARIDRKVGQLNFFDFASSRDILAGQTDSGNTELVPEQLWRYELTVEHRFSSQNVTTLTAYIENYEDYNMLVPFDDGGQGIGNVPSANVKGLDLTSSWALDDIGIKGAKIDFTGSVSKSKIKDPFTGVQRQFDRHEQWIFNIVFRQDIQNTNWAWGFQYWENNELPSYRSDRIIDAPFGPNYDFYVEHKDVFGMTLSIKYFNAFGRSLQFNRTFYEPDRLGNFDGSEERTLNRGGYLNIKLSGKF